MSDDRPGWQMDVEAFARWLYETHEAVLEQARLKRQRAPWSADPGTAVLCEQDKAVYRQLSREIDGLYEPARQLAEQMADELDHSRGQVVELLGEREILLRVLDRLSRDDQGGGTGPAGEQSGTEDSTVPPPGRPDSATDGIEGGQAP